MPGLRSEITKTYLRARGTISAARSANLNEAPVLRGFLKKLRGLSSDAKTDLSKPGSSVPDPALAETTVCADPRQGRLYGNYRILRRLGTGGMGSVYLAIDTRLGRHAALKFLSPRLENDPEMLARLQHEARAASSLNHPNILTIYDISQDGGEPFIASEFVEGNTLRHALKRDLVEPAAALDIACQIASALVPAHAAGIVHRDLKPSNIMLRPDGFVKVIDFGLAKFAAGGYLANFDEPLTTPGAIAGTVQYMSPEQARGERIDQRSDVWSLGVIVYEMLSRRHPFDGETESHIIVAILDHAVPPWKPPAGVSPGVVKILECALAKQPGKRYQSAAEFQAALQELETPSQISRRRRMLPASSITSHPAGRLPFWPLLISLILAAAAFAIWWFPFYGRELALGPKWFNPAGVEQLTHRGDIGTATLSPDAKYVAFTATGQDRDRIHLLDLASKTERLLQPFSGTIFGLAFSPDSRLLYYTVHDERDLGRLYSTSVESTGSPASEATFVLNDIDGPVCFAPDGRQFVFRRRTDDSVTNRNSIVLVHTDDTGDQRIIFSKVNTSIGSRIAWSPDGRTLALIVQKTGLRNSVKDTLTLLTPDGQIRKEIASPFPSISGPVWLNYGSLAGFVVAGTDRTQTQGTLQELFVRGAEWRTATSPPLRINALTISQNADTLSAVTANQTRGSLWVANSSSLTSLEKWPLESESILSFAWSAVSTNGLLLSEQSAAGVSLWESDSPGKSRLISQREGCSQQTPLAIPGGRFIVFVSNCGSGNNFWQLDTLTGQSKQLTRGADFDQGTDVSPDGKLLVYTSWSSNTPSVVRLSLTDGKTTPLSHFQSRSAVISPDGQLVACQIRENYTGLWRFALFRLNDGSLVRDISQLPASAEMILRWSPDGQALDFFDPARGDSRLWRFSLATSTPQLLLDSAGPHITDFHWSPDGRRLALLSALTSSDVVLLHKSTH